MHFIFPSVCALSTQQNTTSLVHLRIIFSLKQHIPTQQRSAPVVITRRVPVQREIINVYDAFANFEDIFQGHLSYSRPSKDIDVNSDDPAIYQP